ncbi:hypothetical protein [Pikeienuella sp. HZG-20]|uniref:hypothetical protein n=1 Tax=Paludibacillus litoralis TaxID=3133267 RepID=UPI0030EDDE0D
MADPSPLGEVAAAATIEEAAARLGALLELDGSAPLPATRRALRDPDFARALIGVRKLPAIRDRLLAGEVQVSAAPTSAAPTSANAPRPPSAAQSVVHAAGAVLKWGMEGMRPAKPWVIERRLAACNACEFQADAPDTLIYRGAKVVVGKDAKICTVCACLTNTKAAISTERCPKRDPEHPELSRWGEPWTDPAEHPDGPWR